VKANQEALARRREELVARSDAQRAELSVRARRLEGPVYAVGSALGLLNSLRRSPLLVTGLAAVLIRTPWRKLARWPKWVWRGWRFAQLVRGWTR
jgi:hypothetical protein